MLGVLKKIAAVAGQTKAVVQQLSTDIKTQREYERLADIDDSAPAPEPQPQCPIEESEPEKGEEDQSQGAMGKWNTFENTLTQNAIAEIRGIDDDKDLDDFAARNFEKKKKREVYNWWSWDIITDIDDWSRMVFFFSKT